MFGYPERRKTIVRAKQIRRALAFPTMGGKRLHMVRREKRDKRFEQ
jgi:hypothetical protein